MQPKNSERFLQSQAGTKGTPTRLAPSNNRYDPIVAWLRSLQSPPTVARRSDAVTLHSSAADVPPLSVAVRIGVHGYFSCFA